MHNWFEGKIQYEKLSPEDGNPKKTTETYLVDALSFTEAEARLIKEVAAYVSGECTVSNIKRAKYYEVFDAPSGDRWYRAKVLFIVIDQEKGTEKRVPATMLLQASDIQEALNRLHEGMKGTMSDYEVAMITDTPIMDVFPYAPVEE